MKLHLFEEQELKVVEEEGKRYYISPCSAKKYPSVTTVLYETSDKTSLEEWRKRVGDREADKVSRKASNRGSQLHNAIEKYILTEKKARLFPNIMQLFFQIKERIDNSITEVYGVELPLFSDELELAGRTDCIANWNGEQSIVDFKTSTRLKREEYCHNYFLQTTAYAIMANEMYHTKIKNMVLCIGVENSNFAQVFEANVDDYKDELIKRRELYNNI